MYVYMDIPFSNKLLLIDCKIMYLSECMVPIKKISDKLLKLF